MTYVDKSRPPHRRRIGKRVASGISVVKQAFGPGSELMKITSKLGFKPTKGCSCGAMAAEMNQLGVSGCREHRERFLSEIRVNFSDTSRAEKLKAVVLSVVTGEALHINPLDPAGSVFDEAVRRAEMLDKS